MCSRRGGSRMLLPSNRSVSPPSWERLEWLVTRTCEGRTSDGIGRGRDIRWRLASSLIQICTHARPKARKPTTLRNETPITCISNATAVTLTPMQQPLPSLQCSSRYPRSNAIAVTLILQYPCVVSPTHLPSSPGRHCHLVPQDAVHSPPCSSQTAPQTPSSPPPDSQ